MTFTAARRRVVSATLLAMVAAMLAVLSVAAPASASHYRATQLVWHKHAGAGPNQVEFHATPLCQPCMRHQDRPD
jgi:hypothetical protein